MGGFPDYIACEDVTKILAEVSINDANSHQYTEVLVCFHVIIRCIRNNTKWLKFMCVRISENTGSVLQSRCLSLFLIAIEKYIFSNRFIRYC